MCSHLRRTAGNRAAAHSRRPRRRQDSQSQLSGFAGVSHRLVAVITSALLWLWIFSASFAAGLYFPALGRADTTDWKPCVETTPLVPCSTDIQYPCGANIPIWKCPSTQPSQRSIDVGTQYFGSQASRHTSGELGYIGAVVDQGAKQDNPVKVIDPDGAIRLGHSVCEKIDAVMVSTHRVPNSIHNDAIQWIYDPNPQHLITIPVAGLTVTSAITFLCPRYRPALYLYNIYS
jgi:Protein of unknown function (DUF732)